MRASLILSVHSTLAPGDVTSNAGERLHIDRFLILENETGDYYYLRF